VDLHPALAFLVEVVGVHLDLVLDRERAWGRAQARDQKRQAERALSHA
jgi:hypothetical protein